MSLIAGHSTKNHQGRNIKRLRTLFGWKQEALAIELGREWSQKRISLIEARAVIDPRTITQIASVLKVSETMVTDFSEEAIVNYFNTYNKKNTENCSCKFITFDQLLEVVEDNKRLYERLLESEREKIEILKRQLK